VTFNRDPLSTDYLMVNRMIRDLRYKRIMYDPGTDIREAIDKAKEALEEVKKRMGDKIDARSM